MVSNVEGMKQLRNSVVDIIRDLQEKGVSRMTVAFQKLCKARDFLGEEIRKSVHSKFIR